MNKPQSHLHILFAGHLSAYGGAEKSMTMVANGLLSSGHSVTLAAFGANIKVYPLNKGVRYIYVADRARHRLGKALGRLYELWKLIRRIKPDVVVCFWLEMCVFAALLSLITGAKVIYSERGDPGDREYLGWLGVVRNIAFTVVNGFVFQTNGAKTYFSKSIQKRSVIIPNPVYIKWDDYALPVIREKRIVNVGRLHAQKNQELLVNAFADIQRDYPEYELHIYGDGSLLPKLRAQIDKLGLGEKVLLKGEVANLAENIVNASLFISTSDYEGMPNALMEAMALGLPCIAANCPPGGPAALIADGKNGLLFPIKDKRALVKCINTLLSDKEYSMQLSTRAKEVCHTHPPAVIYGQWEEFITKIVGAR